MAMTDAEKLRIAVSLENDVGPGVRSVLGSLGRLAQQAAGISDRIGERLSGVLGRIERQAHAINPPFARLSHLSGEIHERVRGIGEASGLTALSERAREAHERLHGLHESLSGLLPAAAGFGFVLSLREGAESLRKSAEYSEQLSLASKATGLTTQQLGGAQYSARIAGVNDPERINRAVEYLNRNRGQLAAGRGGKDLKQLFAEIGATPQMDTAAALARLEDRLRDLLASGNVAAASRLAGGLLGQRSGVALLPWLGQGSAALQAQSAQAARFGLTPTDEQAEEGEKFNKSLKNMDAAVGGLQLTIANKLYPVLAPVIEKFSEWIAANREWIATDIAGEVRGFVGTLQSMNWQPAIEVMKGLGDAALFVMQHLRLVEAGLIAIGTIKLLGVIGVLAGVGRQAALTAAQFALIPVAGLVSSFATLIPAIGGVRDAFAAMSLAASANPLGAAVAGAALLAGAAYEIYQHWEPIADFFKRLWDKISGYFASGWGYIKPIIDDFKDAFGWVENHLPHLPALPAFSSAVPAPGAGSSPLATPISRAARPAQPAKAEITSRVIIDHNNAPPGTTARAVQPAPIDLDLGQAWAW